LIGQHGPSDLRAGAVSAVIMLPQAVALAAVAGMPPESGIYAAALPVAVAAVLGRSGRLLSGPNTAVSVMIAAALVPLAAPLSQDYVALALTLAALVGLFQLLLAVGGGGRLLASMPDFVARGLTLGVGFTLVVSQAAGVFGVLETRGEAPWLALWYASTALDRINPACLVVVAASLLAGSVPLKLRGRRVPPLLAALAAGALAAVALDLAFGPAVARIDRLGYLGISLLPLSLPKLHWEEWYVLQQLMQSALAIAVIGGLQTVVIARSLSPLDEVKRSARREMLAQGAANLVAAFCSGFAGSGSFNRTAAHVQAGARTSAAAVVSVVVLVGLAFAASTPLAYIPVPAVAAVLILIGAGLMRAELNAARGRGRTQRVALLGMALLVVAVGFVAATFIGVAAGIGRLAWQGAHSRGAGRGGTG
jgi:SulP family sulfate permease